MHLYLPRVGSLQSTVQMLIDAVSGQFISSGAPTDQLLPSRRPMSMWPSPTTELEDIISYFSRSEDPVRSAYGKSYPDVVRNMISRVESFR